jgi:peptide/nickel transport system ATP-binding protein
MPELTQRQPALEVRDLTVTIRRRNGSRARVLDRVTFTIARGEAVGLVGESGSGKTMTSLAIMGLLPRMATVDEGLVLLNGDNLLDMSAPEMRRMRGKGLAMVPQDPFGALDPSFTIGDQVGEAFRTHGRVRGNELRAASIASLERVQMPSARERLGSYPHQLSGGMRQRAVSAIALAGEPGLLIADEPTTALDMTTQAQYLGLLHQLRTSAGFALLLISHDLSVTRHMCSRVVVMYAGQVVEDGSIADIFGAPKHPYTRALIKAWPTFDRKERLESIEGEMPTPSDSLPGCRFAGRCRHARDMCRSERPELLQRQDDGRWVRCWGAEPGGWITNEPS